VARERGIDPVEVVIDLSLKHDLKLLFMQPLSKPDWERIAENLTHPQTVVTFSDSGAHVSEICDASLQTFFLSYWVRERQLLTLEQAIRKMTYDIANVWGLHDRGLLRRGLVADVMVFDPKTIAPAAPEVWRDLPAGAARLVQKAKGLLCTVVNGQVLLREGEHTGALPGTVLRSASNVRP
jgi:N-acyl-D-aspartate/D-glutamate deacylase